MSSFSYRVFLLTLLVLAWLTAPAHAQFPPQDPNTPPGFQQQPRVGPPVTLELLSGVERVAPGQTFPLAVRFKMAPTWHVNVANPPMGDGYFEGAYGTTITVDVPDGFAVGVHQWPEAHDVVMGKGTPAAQKVLCIEGDEYVYLPVVVPADAPAGPVEIAVSVDYQTCDYKVCLPPAQRTLKVTVEVDPAAPSDGWEGNSRFAGYDADAVMMPDAGDAADDGHPLSVTASTTTPAVAPGSDFIATLTITLQPKWHVWGPVPVNIPSLGDFESYATSIKATIDGKPVVMGAPQWPEPNQFQFMDDTLLAYDGTFQVQVPVRVPAGLGDGEATIAFAVDNQVCDDQQCLQPRDTIAALTVRVDASAQPNTIASIGTDAGAATGDGTPAAPDADGSTLNIDELGIGFSINTSGFFGIILVILLAALGGFILNLTPCVLPIIPIKIMGLTQSAGNPKRALLLGSAMSVGVVAFWMVIGMLIISIKSFSAISDLFRLPEFVLGIGLFIFAMGFGMLGVFTVQLPKAVYMINPNHESVGGAFFFGVMAAVLSTPCTAPFMGAVTAWATRAGNDVLVLTIFAAIGAGMASPYLVLSAFPKLVSKVPRTGPASELVKQTLGLLMMGVSFFFLGTGVLALGTKYPGLGLALYWWIIVAVIGLAGLWLFIQTRTLTTRSGPRIGTAVGALLVTGGLIWWSVGQTRLSMQAAAMELQAKQDQVAYIRDLEQAVESGGGEAVVAKRVWSDYTPEAYEAAIHAGKTVLLEFDAVW